MRETFKQLNLIRRGNEINNLEICESEPKKK